MVVCKYYLQGRCKFGNNCRNEHTDGSGGAQRQLRFDTQSNNSNRYKWTANQNAAPAPAETGQLNSPVEIISTLGSLMLQWEQGKMWPFSSMAFEKDMPCIPEFSDLTSDELRWEAYQSMKSSGNLSSYAEKVKQLTLEYSNKRQMLKSPTEAIKQQLIQFINNYRHNANNDATKSSIFKPSSFGSSGTSSSMGGLLASGTQSSSSAFGGQSAFGSQTPKTTGLFGGQSTFGGNSNFGSQGSTSTFGSQGSTSTFGGQGSSGTFGGQSSTSTFGAQSSTNTFGSPTTFGSGGSASSIFGQSANATSSAFGQTPGQGSSIFGQSATPSSTISSGFGQPGSSAFGQTATQPSSVFGQNSTASSIFGQGQAQPVTFGQSAAQSSSSSSSSVFGQSQSGSLFGQNPTQGTPATTPQATSQTGSLFGSSGFGTGPNVSAAFGTAPAPAPAPSGGLFGKGGSTSEVASNFKSTVYTPMDKLNEEEIAQFKADHFVLGQIPVKPPPRELVI